MFLSDFWEECPPGYSGNCTGSHRYWCHWCLSILTVVRSGEGGPLYQRANGTWTMQAPSQPTTAQQTLSLRNRRLTGILDEDSWTRYRLLYPQISYRKYEHYMYTWDFLKTYVNTKLNIWGRTYIFLIQECLLLLDRGKLWITAPTCKKCSKGAHCTGIILSQTQVV